MPDCPLCKASFPSKPELDRHECASLIPQEAPTHQSPSLIESIHGWGWATPLVGAIIFGINKLIAFRQAFAGILQMTLLLLYVVCFVVLAMELKRRIKARQTRGIGATIAGVCINGGGALLMVILMGYIVSIAGPSALFTELKVPAQSVTVPVDLAADGSMVQGSGFSFRLPRGWRQKTDNAWCDDAGQRGIFLAGEVVTAQSLEQEVSAITQRLADATPPQSYVSAQIACAVPCMKMVPQQLAPGNQRMFQFVFEGPQQRKLIFVCVTTAGNDPDTVFDRPMITLTIAAAQTTIPSRLPPEPPRDLK
jgi:hypothetical protein